MKQTWLITGASRGLGAMIAQAVLAQGNNLVATARDKNSIHYVTDSLDVLPVSLDVTSEAQAELAVQAAVARFGRIDVLVNNAGYGLLGAIEESSAADVEAIYRTNVFGTLNLIRAVLPIMRAQKSGHIINMSSLGGYQSSVGFGIYCSTKFAVEGITEALYGEVKPLGIHATVVEPGFFRTDFLDGRSLQHSKEEMSDYFATVGKVRGFAAAHNHEQPGDPAKLAAALLQLVALPDPPLRLPLGSDAVRRVAAKNSFVAEEMERWRTLSESTDLH